MTRQPSRADTQAHASGPVTRYPPARPDRLSLEGLAHRCGLHPQHLRRLVALGVLDAARDASGRLWFSPRAEVRLARVQRLRAGLPLNYAAIGLVLDLLERIDQLQAAVRGRRWP